MISDLAETYNASTAKDAGDGDTATEVSTPSPNGRATSPEHGEAGRK